MKTEEKIKELERRIEDLERRPLYVPTYPVYPQQPYNPPPLPSFSVYPTWSS